MYAVIYRGSIYPDREREYKQAWRIVAEYFVTERGALGSCLHKTEQDEWLAYSRWPDQNTRDAAWLAQAGLPVEISAAIEVMKGCIDRGKPYEEISMRIMDDFLFDKNQAS